MGYKRTSTQGCWSACASIQQLVNYHSTRTRLSSILTGVFDKATIKGVLKRMHPVDGRQVAEERVVLKRNANLTNGMRDYLSEDDWNADANRVLKRLGPPGKYEATRRQGGKVRPLSGESAVRPAILFSVTVTPERRRPLLRRVTLSAI
jgi:hypothetical protein